MTSACRQRLVTHPKGWRSWSCSANRSPAGTVQDNLGFLMGVPLADERLRLSQLRRRQLRRHRVTGAHRLIMALSRRETGGGQLEPAIRLYQILRHALPTDIYP